MTKNTIYLDLSNKENADWIKSPRVTGKRTPDKDIAVPLSGRRNGGEIRKAKYAFPINVVRLEKAWTDQDEEKHPRGGNPKNKGEFSKKPGRRELEEETEPLDKPVAPNPQDYRGMQRKTKANILGFGRGQVRTAVSGDRKEKTNLMRGEKDFEYENNLLYQAGHDKVPNGDVSTYYLTASDNQRGRMKNEIVYKLSKQTGLRYDVVDGFIHAWASSSNEQHLSVLMQKAVVNLFGGKTSEWQDSVAIRFGADTIYSRLDSEMNKRASYRNDFVSLASSISTKIKEGEETVSGAIHDLKLKTGGDDEFLINTLILYMKTHLEWAKYWNKSKTDPDDLDWDESEKEALDFYDSEMKGTPVTLYGNWRPYRVSGNVKKGDAEKIVKQIYQNTQDHFRKMGLGPDDEITLFRGIEINTPNEYLGKQIVTRGNAAESWSSDYRVANGFGHTVIARKVKTRNILSSFLTGFGCMTELEYITLGNANAPAVLVQAEWR